MRASFSGGGTGATRFARLPVAAVYLYSFLGAASTYGDPFPLMGTFYTGKGGEMLVLADALLSLYLFIGILKRQRLTLWLLIAYNLFDLCNACINLTRIPFHQYATLAGSSLTEETLRLNTLIAASLLLLITFYVLLKRSYFDNRSPYLF